MGSTPKADESKRSLRNLLTNFLKYVIKKAIIDKGIDIDRFKYRFVDKNALFNFKQVLKGDNRLSMLLFDRGVEAFNLKYTIVHELNGNAMKIDTGK